MRSSSCELVAVAGALEQHVRERAIELARDDADHAGDPERRLDRQVRPLAAALAQRLEIERGDRDVGALARHHAVHDAALEAAVGERPQRGPLQRLRQVREIAHRREARRARRGIAPGAPAARAARAAPPPAPRIASSNQGTLLA